MCIAEMNMVTAADQCDWNTLRGESRDPHQILAVALNTQLTGRAPEGHPPPLSLRPSQGVTIRSPALQVPQ